MKKIFVEGHGILGKKDGIKFRQQHQLDKLDYSIDPIIVDACSSSYTLSSSFVFEAFKSTADKCYNGIIPFHNNNPFALSNNETGWFPLVIGPYVLKLGLGNEFREHAIMNAMIAWRLNWQREKVLLSLSPKPLQI